MDEPPPPAPPIAADAANNVEIPPPPPPPGGRILTRTACGSGVGFDCRYLHILAKFAGSKRHAIVSNQGPRLCHGLPGVLCINSHGYA
jgi:hypothetical protein